MTVDGGWKPTLSLDRESRRAKATKMVRLIESYRTFAGSRVLEIGTGGGVIASLLAEHVGDQGEVWSVDVEDMRVVSDGYQFKLVEGTVLPFDDDEFDVVISNHTIEHVGETSDQITHLREISRVLKPAGITYLASPSRWALIEPHFKVPFLSWFPVGLRDRVLRLSRRGTIYDINPLSRTRFSQLIDDVGLSSKDITLDALQVAATTEKGKAARIAAGVPEAALRLFRGMMPTSILVVAHEPTALERG